MLIALLTDIAAVASIAEESLGLVYLLTAGLLYGWMRRRRPMPGSTAWQTVTLLLVVPAVPAYGFDLLAANTSDVLLLPWAAPISISITLAVALAIGALSVRAWHAHIQPSYTPEP
jgi:hypothetical protein